MKSFVLTIAAWILSISLLIVWVLSLRPAHFRPGSLKDKNIIVISIDALRADHLGTYGYHRQSSPFTDAFAREAIVFEKAFAPASYTLASHVSLFTGLYKRTHKVSVVYDADGAWTKTSLSRKFMTMAEYFASTGRSAVFAAGSGNHQLSFKDSEGRGFETQLPNFMRMERLFKWIDENPDKKFFAFLHTSQVHDPYYNRGYNYPTEHQPVFSDPSYKGLITGSFAETLKKFNESRASNLTKAEIYSSHYHSFKKFWWGLVNFSDPVDVQRLKDQYDNCIFHADLKIGRLIAWLKAKDLFEKTVIVLTSDHGEAFGEHGEFRHNTVHKEILHIPLIFRVPGARSRRVKGLVSLIDVFPTLLELDGAPRPDYMEGKSLIPVMRQLKRATHKHFFASGADNISRSVSDGKWKLIRRANGEKELYNTVWDFEETEDLSDKRPKTVKKLDRTLDAFLNNGGS